MYTEEGRKSVKICNYIPSQQCVQNSAHHNAIANQTQTTQNTLHIDPNSNEANESEANTSGNSTNTALQTTTATVAVSSNLSSLQTYGQKLAAFQQQQQQGSVGGTAMTVSVGPSNTTVNTKIISTSGKKG